MRDRCRRLRRRLLNKLEKYLKEQTPTLVNEVEAEKTLVTLVNELAKLFPASHGLTDKVHAVWGRCLRDLVWLGWVSEAKKRRGKYDSRFCKILEQSLRKAFTIGKGYAVERK